jgi:endo-1,4-beta-xylanase
MRSAYAADFMVGAALAPKHIDNVGMRGKNLLIREYNTITPENIMKWGEINPEPEVFNWTEPDLFVQFGEDNDMFMVGHALVWHSQLSDYVKEITNPGLMREALKAHINAVAGRYKGRIDAWDVVNEALNEDGTMRESVFYQVLGEDYMTDAFKIAAVAAGPETELYYNDYNMWNADKRDGAIRMLNRMRANGARIDGVGMQAHYSIIGPTIDTIERAIEAYAAAGYKVMMTELDVSVLPNPWDLEGVEVSQNFENSPFMNPYPESLPDSMQTVLADRYEDLFKLYLKHADKIGRVTFWGVNDGHSWLNGWPIKDRMDYPLLFDREYAPKPAYERVMSLRN